MTTVEYVDPHEVAISDLNERKSDVTTDDLEDSIESEGIIEGLEPVVRESDEDDSKYEAFIGQRRILASRKVGLEEIPVRVTDRGDEAALKASVVENAQLFTKGVPPSDRANALDRLWELMGGDGYPSSTVLADDLGVPESTIRTWLEPLRDEWEDTDVDPTTDDDSDDEPTAEFEAEEADEESTDVDYEEVADDEEVNDSLVEETADRDPDGPEVQFEGGSSAEAHGEIDSDEGVSFDPDASDEEDEDESTDVEVDESDEQTSDVPETNIVDELGEEKLRKIRTMTGGGEEGEQVAKKVAEEGMTTKEIDEVKTLHERGNEIEEAIAQVQSADEDGGPDLRTEVKLTGETADEVERLAEERSTTESEVVGDAVEYYLEHHE